jgi:hypothetical protein
VKHLQISTYVAVSKTVRRRRDRPVGLTRSIALDYGSEGVGTSIVCPTCVEKSVGHSAATRGGGCEPPGSVGGELRVAGDRVAEYVESGRDAEAGLCRCGGGPVGDGDRVFDRGYGDHFS